MAWQRPQDRPKSTGAKQHSVTLARMRIGHDPITTAQSRAKQPYRSACEAGFGACWRVTRAPGHAVASIQQHQATGQGRSPMRDFRKDNRTMTSRNINASRLLIMAAGVVGLFAAGLTTAVAQQQQQQQQPQGWF